LFAAAIVGLEDARVSDALNAFRAKQTQDVLDHSDPRKP
jgi:5-(carboxyamino)imidazole ribonucleotide mutase